MMNRMMRNASLVLSTILMLGALAGCSGKEAATQKSGTDGTAAPADKPSYSFRLAETHPPDYPTTLGDKKFAELVSEKSGGRIKIDVFPSAQLGEEKAVIEQVQLGAIEFTRVSSGALASFNKEYGVFSLPFIFENQDHMWKFLKGEQGEKLLNSLESSKMKGLTYFDPGARGFYTKEPVTKLEDLKGKKIRVIQNQINIDVMEALGASATPMPYGEVFSAVQTGVIDGAENNYPSYYSSRHYEVAKNYLADEHQRVPEVLLISTSTWEKLSPEDQKILKEAALESVEYQIEAWNKFDKESKEKVIAAGAIVTEVTDLQPWKDAVKPVIDKYRAEFGATLEAIEKAKQ